MAKRKKTMAEIVMGLKEMPVSNPSLAELNSNPPTDYPLFGFKYLNDSLHKNYRKGKFFVDFLERLNKLSNLGWKEIEKADRHGYGTEKIDIDSLRPVIELPPQFANKRKLSVFRATGDNHVFAGIREENTFHIFFIETEFGDLYDHD